MPRVLPCQFTDCAGGASTDHFADLATKMGPIVACFQGLQGLGDAEMACESSPMKLPNEEITGGTSGNAEAVAEEKEPGFHSIVLLWSRRLCRFRLIIVLWSRRQCSILSGLPEVGAFFVDKWESIESRDCRLRGL